MRLPSVDLLAKKLALKDFNSQKQPIFKSQAVSKYNDYEVKIKITVEYSNQINELFKSGDFGQKPQLIVRLIIDRIDKLFPYSYNIYKTKDSKFIIEKRWANTKRVILISNDCTVEVIIFKRKKYTSKVFPFDAGLNIKEIIDYFANSNP